MSGLTEALLKKLWVSIEEVKIQRFSNRSKLFGFEEISNAKTPKRKMRASSVTSAFIQWSWREFQNDITVGGVQWPSHTETETETEYLLVIQNKCGYFVIFILRKNTKAYFLLGNETFNKTKNIRFLRSRVKSRSFRNSCLLLSCVKPEPFLQTLTPGTVQFLC